MGKTYPTQKEQSFGLGVGYGMNTVIPSMMSNYGLAAYQHLEVGLDSKSFRCTYRLHDQTNATFRWIKQWYFLLYKSTDHIYLDDKPLSLDTCHIQMLNSEFALTPFQTFSGETVLCIDMAVVILGFNFKVIFCSRAMDDDAPLSYYCMSLGHIKGKEMMKTDLAFASATTLMTAQFVEVAWAQHVTGMCCNFEALCATRMMFLSIDTLNADMSRPNVSSKMKGLDKTTYDGFVDIDPQQDEISLRTWVALLTYSSFIKYNYEASMSIRADCDTTMVRLKKLDRPFKDGEIEKVEKYIPFLKSDLFRMDEMEDLGEDSTINDNPSKEYNRWT
ncbi:hypothetical protein Tco_1502457 [Tanacetum coccineum]